MVPFLVGLAMVLVGVLVVLPAPVPTLLVIFGIIAMVYGAFTYFGGGPVIRR